MNNKIIGVAVVLVIAGFFALVANAQLAGNQSVSGNFTVSNQTVNSIINNNNNINFFVLGIQCPIYCYFAHFCLFY